MIRDPFAGFVPGPDPYLRDLHLERVPGPDLRRLVATREAIRALRAADTPEAAEEALQALHRVRPCSALRVLWGLDPEGFAWGLERLEEQIGREIREARAGGRRARAERGDLENA